MQHLPAGPLHLQGEMSAGFRLKPTDRVRYVRTQRGWFWIADDLNKHEGPFDLQSEAIAAVLSRTAAEPVVG